MKRNNIHMTAAAALVALTAVTGIGYMAFAQTATTTENQDIRDFVQSILTPEQKAQIEARIGQEKAEVEARHTEMGNAIAQGYDAWVAVVVKYQGEDAPVLDEVTREEFPRFAEAHGYMDDARESMAMAQQIFEEIGVRGEGKMGMGKMMGGKGMGKMMGGQGGMHGGFMGDWNATDSSSN